MINDGYNFQFNTPKGTSSPYSGYIDKIMGTNTSGFIKDYNNNTDGTDSTYFSDSSDVGPGVPGGFNCCGGYWRSGSATGAFYSSLIYAASDSMSDLGARLMYKHLASSGGGSNS